VLLASVLALDSADLGTLGAVAAELERALRINDLQLGILASVVSLSAALATLPIGWLTDRVPRVPLLAASIGVWSSAMVMNGAAVSFPMLLLTRLALGAVQASSGPTLASLVGDLFQVRERSRIFGFIHAGELLGAGFGFLVSGVVAALLSWRWSFWLLAAPGFALTFVLWRGLPEPARGGASRLPAAGRNHNQDNEIIQRLVEEQRVTPDRERLVRGDPARLSAHKAAAYLLRIPTNRRLIMATALGYFFLGGARTFGVIFVRGHYHLAQAAATSALAALGIGAVVGVLTGGRVADRLLNRGRLNARVLVGGVGYMLAAAAFVPAVVSTQLVVALPLYVLATAFLTAPNAPLDAATLDVTPGGMWGRAQGIQTALRTLAMAAAPVLFGFLADVLGKTTHDFGQATLGSGGSAGAQGLEVTFLIMLVPLLIAGVILLRSTRTYPRDAATTAELSARDPTSVARTGHG
jgi:MFS family permease